MILLLAALHVAAQVFVAILFLVVGLAKLRTPLAFRLPVVDVGRAPP